MRPVKDKRRLYKFGSLLKFFEGLRCSEIRNGAWTKDLSLDLVHFPTDYRSGRFFYIQKIRNSGNERSTALSATSISSKKPHFHIGSREEAALLWRSVVLSDGWLFGCEQTGVLHDVVRGSEQRHLERRTSGGDCQCTQDLL